LWEQNRSFNRPVLQEATVQRTQGAPGAIAFRQFAHAMDTVTMVRR
jgi:hypothetical protein